MESPLWHAIFEEGAALYRNLRNQRLHWEEALRPNGTTLRAPPGGDGRAGSRRVSSPLHVYYPLLFRSLFEEIPIETVRELSLADRLYTEHLLSYDRIVDGQVPFQTDGLFLAHLEHMQSLRRLYPLFPVGHPFWDYFYDCYFETWKSIREEKLFHSHRVGSYPIARFRALAKGKTAILKPFSVALAFLSTRTGERKRLSASLDQHHIALVLLDDLEDWRQDFQKSNFTFLLTRLVHKTGLQEEICEGRVVSPDRIGRLLHGTGLMERQLRLAEVSFQNAVQTVEDLPLPLWKSFNLGFRSRCRSLRHDLAEIRRREEQRIRVRKSLGRPRFVSAGKHLPPPAVGQLRAGIAFLRTTAAGQGSFPLSVSPHMYMCPSTRLAASTFTTTLIARSLDRIKDMDPCLSPLLLRSRNWLDHPDRTRPSPGLPTTLEGAFSPAPSDPHQLLPFARAFAPAHGPLPDGLYWANFLYTCSRKSFKPSRLTAFVLDCMARGSYVPWSHGFSFGPVEAPWTRRACRPLLPLFLLCRALPEDMPREAVRLYLLAPYRATQTWNHTTETVLTLLCLLETGYEGPAIGPGLEKVSGSQEPDGSWSPNAVYKEGDLFYGSRELTTAWCLELLVRCGART